MDFYFGATTEAALVKFLVNGGYLVVDAEANLSTRVCPDGHRPAEGVNMVYFPANSYVVEKAVVDKNGDITTPAVTSSNVFCNIRTESGKLATEPDVELKKNSSKQLRASEYPKAKGGVDKNVDQRDDVTGDVWLIANPTFKRNIWAGDTPPPEWG